MTIGQSLGQYSMVVFLALAVRVMVSVIADDTLVLQYTIPK